MAQKKSAKKQKKSAKKQKQKLIPLRKLINRSLRAVDNLKREYEELRKYMFDHVENMRAWAAGIQKEFKNLEKDTKTAVDWTRDAIETMHTASIAILNWPAEYAAIMRKLEKNQKEILDLQKQLESDHE